MRARVIAPSLLALGLFWAGNAKAYEVYSIQNCPAINLSGPAEVVLHVGEEAEGLGFLDLLALVAAMEDINAQINLVGKSSASITGITTTEEPFEFLDWFGDTSPTIHIGFSPDLGLFEQEGTVPATAMTWYGGVNLTTCDYDEAHIVVQAPSLQTFAWGVPEDYDEDFFDMPATLPGGEIFFRRVYLHELLHAFGLQHTENSYSMLNYGVYPWARRLPESQLRPLPDDIEGLRALYPDVGVRREIGIFTTWYGNGTPINGAAIQGQLCQPSVGAAWADEFAVNCSSPAQTGSLVGGELLRTQSAVANYGTEALTVKHRLYFSQDTTLNPEVSLTPFSLAKQGLSRLVSPSGALSLFTSPTPTPVSFDVASETVFTYELGQSSSARKGFAFKIPKLPNGTYHLIAHVSGKTAAGAETSDWIPLRGTIYIYKAPN